MFFSNNEESDFIYREFGLESMTSERQRKISKNTPYLYLLCLVDTLECAKKFAKSKNKKEYLRVETILRKIDVIEEKEAVIFDYSRLYQHINQRKKETLKFVFHDWLRQVNELGVWTEFDVESVNEMAVRIKTRVG